ncbi:histamine H4 receptor isoform X2 [Microtus oregoni]|uniref:histamine H4 receptor-like isoform X2 n=1 Tax=Microtus oregoni TaxID=111838 RepID=UPI001BB11894|nr:histamine H4 receptor-like isoform X2 [Microtus oregoni]XP_041516580.1 histamine H4 receptor isoform X2 [Microtus oregoni]
MPLEANSSGSLTLTAKVSLALLMSLLAFAIMLGNAVVILAFVVDKNLRHRSNYFLLNLAISDFFVEESSWKDSNSTVTNECEPGFVSKWYILAITTFLEFLVPVISVAYFNVQIYWSLWKRGSLNRCCSHVGFIPTSSSDSGHLPRAGDVSRTPLPASKESATSLHLKCPRRKSSLLVSLRTHTNSNAFKVGSLLQSEASALHRREHTELLRGRKLARSLAILLGAFAICWAPYCLSTIVLSAYAEGERPKSIWYTIAFWLQWFNSFVNPFLYPLCHRSFQKAFWKIFCVKRQHAPSQNQSVSS